MQLDESLNARRGGRSDGAQSARIVFRKRAASTRTGSGANTNCKLKEDSWQPRQK
jgi:hypothetical protein